MKIETISIDKLKPYEKNAKLHPQAQIEQIKKSIEMYGNNDPIAVWGKNNTIVEGHGRYLALKEMGATECEIIRLDHLTNKQRREYMLVHNKLTMNTDFDFDILDEELGDLDFDGFDFGFEMDTEYLPEEIDEDEIPEPPAEPKAKLGDLYQLGDHRLICGDSTDVNVIDRLIGGVTINLLLTDPPYGIDIVGGGKPFGKVGGGKLVESNTYSEIIGDDTTDTARACYDVALMHTDNQIIFGGNYFTDFLPPSRCWVVWDKQNTGNFADAELAWTSFEKSVKLYRFMWNGLVREGNRKEEGISRVHPTQKPVGLMGYILNDFSSENDNVLDMFGGSGSTLIACEQLNRKCFMCELDPHYIDVIIERWENLTGQKAVLLDD